MHDIPTVFSTISFRTSFDIFEYPKIYINMSLITTTLFYLQGTKSWIPTKTSDVSYLLNLQVWDRNRNS